MITRLFFDFLAALASFVTGLLPTSPPPSWVSTGGGYLSTVLGYGAGLGAWVPWSLVGVVFAAVMGCLIVSFGIKVTRILASFFLAGGGSAG